MLNRNSVDTAKNIIKVASSELGLDFIDENYSLFSEDEGGRLWLTALKLAIEEILQDIFDNKLSFNKDIAILFPFIDSKGGKSYYKYNVADLPIFRIYSVRDMTGKEIYRKESYFDLEKQDGYVEQPFSFIRSIEGRIVIEYLSRKIFFKNIDGEFILNELLESDEDYIFLDKTLLTYKICSNVSNSKGLPNSPYYQDLYNRRLNYIIEEDLSGGETLRIC